MPQGLRGADPVPTLPPMPDPAPPKAGDSPFVCRTGEIITRLLQSHPSDGLVLWQVGNPWPKMHDCAEVPYTVARITLINGDAETRENVEFEIIGFPTPPGQDATDEHKLIAKQRKPLRRMIPFHRQEERETICTEKDLIVELRERAASDRDKDSHTARALFESAVPNGKWDDLDENAQASWIERVVNINIRANELLAEEDEATLEDEDDEEAETES